MFLLFSSAYSWCRDVTVWALHVHSRTCEFVVTKMRSRQKAKRCELRCLRKEQRGVKSIDLGSQTSLVVLQGAFTPGSSGDSVPLVRFTFTLHLLKQTKPPGQRAAAARLGQRCPKWAPTRKERSTTSFPPLGSLDRPWGPFASEPTPTFSGGPEFGRAKVTLKWPSGVWAWKSAL